MDLARDFPRSPRAVLGGMVWLPRLIDKARAKLAGTLGEYSYNCPMDVRFFGFTGIDADAFLKAVARSPDDGAVLRWVTAHALPATDGDRAEFNETLLSLGPDTPESRSEFNETVRKIAPGRDGITTWCQMMDLEEGRI